MVEVLYGKICTGKTSYAKSREDVIVLNVDELLDRMSKDCEGPKAHKALEVAIIDYYLTLIEKLEKLGIDTVLDHGLWYKDEREHVKKFLKEKGIPYHFIRFDEDEKVRRMRLIERNERALRPIALEKLAFFDALFEEDEDEVQL